MLTEEIDEQEIAYLKWYESPKYECFFCRDDVVEEEIELIGSHGYCCRKCYIDRKEDV